MSILARWCGGLFVLAALPASLVAQDGGDECWFCEGTLSCDSTGCSWVSGSIGCDEAGEGEGGKVNCLDDQNGEICELDDFDSCELINESPDALAFVLIPSVNGSSTSLVRVAEKVACATGESVGARVEAVEE